MKLRQTLLILTISFVCTGLNTYGAEELASEEELYNRKREAFANPKKDNPDLPNVLLFGDSISIGYTPYVRRLISEKADLYRIPTNVRHSSYGLENLDKWLELKSLEWDVIHFNWGLWDLCCRHRKAKTQGHRDKVNGALTTTPEQYRANMEQIVARMKDTGATLIWCTTTPVPEGEAGRKLGDDLKYNNIAEEIMKTNGVLINDLHSHALLKLPDIQVQEGDVHFTEEGYQHLAEKVAREISLALLNAGEVLRSPDGKIEVKLLGEKGNVTYSVSLNGKAIIGPSTLGLKSNATELLKIVEVTLSSADNVWKSVWGAQKTHHDTYHEIQLKVGGASAQTIIFRAYNDGVAFRYLLPKTRKISEPAYAYEASTVSFVSEQPTAWFPLSSTLVSDAVDLNSWEPAKEGQKKVNKNTHYTFKFSIIKTPFTVKLSDKAYISIHEAAVTHSDDAGVKLAGNTLTYCSNNKTAGGFVTPWRTITIADRPGGLIESSLIVNLNQPSEIEDTAWVRPGKTMWDWRNHGAHADDGFEYGMITKSYIRYIDFAAEHGVEYVLVDAGWYGPERGPKSDPKTFLPQIDIPKICAYGKKKGVGIWLYVNTKGLADYDLDETFTLYREWGVAGIKQGFLSGASRKHIEFSHQVVKKCAEYQLMYVVHEPYKPTGYRRTYPNIFSFEYVNSMLDGPSRPSATPSRLINSLFVHALAGPVDRSCGMFDLDSYITREKCHRQLPSTVVSQTAQCLLFPSGLLTLPDHPDAYKRKADLFEFISRLPMNWDETKILDAEIGKHITMARRAGDQWFVGALADEKGRTSTVTLDFLEAGVVYDVTLYEDAADAHYEYFGPANKREAKANNQEMKPHKTRRELYQVRRITAQKGAAVAITIAPGGGHCMWIRPVKN